MKSGQIQKITASGLLIAIGILIPMISPFKILLEPASFTLASHVAIFIAMMISPAVGIAVALGTTLGFLFAWPLVVALRAASHLIFTAVGGLYLQKRPETLSSPKRVHIFSLLIGLLHAVCELIVVAFFYFGGGMSAGYYESGFLRSVLLLVGLGTVIHSMVDFEIALVVYKVLSKQRSFSALSHKSA